MSYFCEKCKYKTDDKSNYNKHLKSKHHITKLLDITTKEIDNSVGSFVNVKYECPNCHKTYSSASSLSRHKNKFCKGNKKEMSKKTNQIIKKQITNKDDEVIHITKSQLEDKLRIKELEAQVSLLNKYINSDKIAKNVNITVIKYAQENYPDAPPLSKIDDYSCLEDDESELLESIIKKQKDNLLHKYLGDFIVKYYKKDNQSEQSLWNTDVSRLSYVIKELMINNKSVWTKDKEGIKTKEYIIKPLLLYIKNVIENHIDKYTDVDQNNYDDMIERFNDGYVLLAIKMAVCNGQLSHKIIKYITPYFYMDKMTNLLETT